MLPDLEEFKSFPARGPEGSHSSDINERAAAIECYLDLRIPGRPDAEVVWSNYKMEVDQWHRALDYKETYVRHFLDQSEQSIRDGAYDMHKLEMVVRALIAEAAALAPPISRPQVATENAARVDEYQATGLLRQLW